MLLWLFIFIFFRLLDGLSHFCLLLRIVSFATMAQLARSVCRVYLHFFHKYFNYGWSCQVSVLVQEVPETRDEFCSCLLKYHSVTVLWCWTHICHKGSILKTKTQNVSQKWDFSHFVDPKVLCVSNILCTCVSLWLNVWMLFWSHFGETSLIFREFCEGFLWRIFVKEFLWRIFVGCLISVWLLKSFVCVPCYAVT